MVKGGITMQNKITIYTTSDCSYCDMLKTDLKKEGYLFEEKNISKNVSFQQELYDKAIFSVPVLMLNEKLFIGYHKHLVHEISNLFIK